MSFENRSARARQGDRELDAALAEMGTELKVSAEWKVVLALLDGGWPGTATKAEQMAFVTFLNDLDHLAVVRALRQLAHNGAKYRPNPAEVRALVPAAAGRVPGLTATTESAEAWQTVLGFCEEQLPEATFKMWIAPVRCEGEADQLLYVSARDTIAAWAERRYLVLMTEATVDLTPYGGVKFCAQLPARAPAEARVVEARRRLAP